MPGHCQTEDGRGILHHPCGIVRARTATPDFPELHALLANLPSRKIARSLQFPFGLSWELPATPGCQTNSKLIARSRNCTHSSRCSTRRAYSISFGPKPLVPITQNRKDEVNISGAKTS